jgi:excisionase family DNA binding protein
MTTNTDLAALLAQLAQALAEQKEPSREPPTARPMPERILLKVEEAAERLGIGRTTAYALVRTGDLESVVIGTLRRIPVTAVKEYAARLVAEQSAA